MVTESIAHDLLHHGSGWGLGDHVCLSVLGAAVTAAPAQAGLVAAPARPLGDGLLSVDELLDLIAGVHSAARGNDIATGGGGERLTYPR